MYCTDNVDSLHIRGQTYTDIRGQTYTDSCHKICIDTL